MSVCVNEEVEIERMDDIVEKLPEVCLKCAYGAKRKDGLSEGIHIKPSGSPNPVLYFVGEAPGRTEVENREFFTGMTGSFLKHLLHIARKMLIKGSSPNAYDFGPIVKTARYWYKSNDFQRVNKEILAKYRFNNVVRSFPTGKTLTIKPKRLCRQFLEEDIISCNPNVIVTVGSHATKSFFSSDVRVTDLHCSIIPAQLDFGNFHKKVFIVPLEHPSSVFRKNSPKELERYAKDVVAVFMDAINLSIEMSKGKITPKPIDIDEMRNNVDIVKNVGDLVRFQSFVSRKVEEGGIVAIDVETSALSPYEKDSRILCFAVSDGNETFSILYDDSEQLYCANMKYLLKLLLFSKAEILAHNTGFDLEWLAVFLSDDQMDFIRKVEQSPVHDTMIMSYIADHRKSHSLNSLMLRYFGMDLKAMSDVDRSKILHADTDELLMYCGLDALACRILYDKLKEILDREDLFDTYKRFVKRVPVITCMQNIGTNVDFDTVESLISKMDDEYRTLLKSFHSNSDVEKYERKVRNESGDEEYELNYKSPKQLSDFFFNFLGIKTETGSTDKHALGELQHPVASMVLDLRSYRKLVDDYLANFNGYSAKYVSGDGKVHTNFLAIGTVTGRLSSRNPNMQNLPKRSKFGKEIRKIIVPEKGNVLVSADYAAMEVRGIASLSGDKTLIGQIVSGEDMHAFWTRKLVQENPELFRNVLTDGEYRKFLSGDEKTFKKVRGMVKNIFVFPLFYGCANRKVYTLFMISSSKLIESMDRVISCFWDTYKGVADWQMRTRAEYARNRRIRNPNGLVYREPLTINEIYNYPVQGLCADVCIDAMVRLHEHALETGKYHLHPVLNIHDELVFEFPEAVWEDAVGEISGFLVSYGLDIFKVPIVVEVSTGENFGEMELYKEFSSSDVFPDRKDGEYLEEVRGFLPRGA